MKRGGKRGCLVGAGVAGRMGGDACVAHGGSCDAMAQQGEGDASVPSHRIRHPRPYGYDPSCPLKIPPSERPGDWGLGRRRFRRVMICGRRPLKKLTDSYPP